MFIVDQIKKSDPQLRVMAIAMLCGLAVLFSGLWYVQIIASRKFKDSLQSQSFRLVRIPAARGKILDRQGRVMAENVPTYNVGLYVEELSPEFKNQFSSALKYYAEQGRKLSREDKTKLGAFTRYQVASNVVATLGRVVGTSLTIDFKTFTKHYAQDRFVPLPVLTEMTSDQVARFSECTTLPPGLDLFVRPLRHYPNGSLAAHVIGQLMPDKKSMEGEIAFFDYRPNDYRGRLGIEGAFDDALRGQAGAKSVLVNNLVYRQAENIWLNAVPGSNVVLTIDLGIQKVAEDAIRNSGLNVHGAAVVMNVNTGDILALASLPNYDPSMFVDGLTFEEADYLADTNFLRQVNRATQGIYPPGSTFKIVTGLAGLETGNIDPREIFDVEPDPTRPTRGAVFVGKRKIEDTAPPGKYDLDRAYKRSSNSYFVHEGLKPGMLLKMVELGEALHFGERTGIPLLQDSPANFPTVADVTHGWNPGDTANMAIGQGAVTATPLQVAVMISALANGGSVLSPRIVDRFEPQDPYGVERPVVTPSSIVRNHLPVQPAHLAIVRKALLGVVSDQIEGAGKEAFVPGMNICGKTGTAEIQRGGRTVDKITWFASFAPYEQPRYAVVVMIRSGRSGGSTCAPIARKIYLALRQLEAGDPSRELTGLN